MTTDTNMKIINGDCLIKLTELKDNTIDSVVTDPPYELGFMGKTWDGTGIAYNVELWKEVLRVLKPGGYLLSFGGTRTHHRMATAIEDAGFEIRDMIAWVYGSGFPKSLNIGKAVDRLQGNEREDLGDGQYANRRPRPTAETNIEGAEYGFGSGHKITKGTSEWEGWGTALKPALEPICVARKPLSEKTVAKNVLKWGTGGINIDGSRIGTESTKTTIKDLSEAHGNQFGKAGIKYPTQGYKDNPPGRFPANLIHDGSEEVERLFPNTKSGKFKKGSERKPRIGREQYGNMEQSHKGIDNFGDSGSASRFFYCAKSSKTERNKGLEGFEEKGVHRYGAGIGEGKHPEAPSIDKNNHPTVKPISLMRYLVKLVTPPEGTVLDPFMGSGTTGIACKLEGFDFIGIEREEEYVNIAEARIKAYVTQEYLIN